MDKEKSIRITKSIIQKRCMLSSLIEKKIDKLPKTENYLSLVWESVEEFQPRRVRNIIYRAEKEEIWEIYREAGLRKGCSYGFKEIIEEYINMRNKYRC